MKRWLAAAAVTIATVVTGTLVVTHRTSEPTVPASPAPVLTRADRMFVMTNEARVVRGLPKVARSEAADEMAAQHALHMARTGELHHHGDYKWSWWGENVGVGDTVRGLFHAFMRSASHRAIILGDFTDVGIGFAHRDGKLWVTMVFYRQTT